MAEPARTAPRRARSISLAALVAVSAALVGVLLFQSLASSALSSAPTSSSPTASPTDAFRSAQAGAPGEADGVLPAATTVPRTGHAAALTDADGVLPAGVTVFDSQYPGVANLNPALLRALRQAATDAAANGLEFYVDSGWRSWGYQEQLFRQAVSQYGSEAKAARWVALPGTSPHESGDAVDIGHSDAVAWLSEHGAAYGLCQIYGNEPWHFELRRQAVHQGCPPMYADPTHDPRMQQ